MRNFLFSDLKEFLSNEVNRVFVAVLFFGVFMAWQQYHFSTEILQAVDSAEKKVDYRYFNLTNSIQDIHKVEIDTKHGRVVK